MSRAPSLAVALGALSLTFGACFGVKKVGVDDGGAGGSPGGATGGAGVATGSGGRAGTGGAVGTGGAPGAGTGGATGTGGGATGTGGGATGTGGGAMGTGGGATGSGGVTTGSGGARGSGGIAGTGGVSGCGVSIDPFAHHLGDGDGTEGTSLSRTFSLPCSCSPAWLSFQIVGPNYEQAPRVSVNGQQLPSLQSFFPPMSTGGWQINSGGSSHDYNGYMQIHYDVSGRVVVGANTFSITNGATADDYEFSDVRVECGVPTNPLGPDIVSRGGWVGTIAERSDDDPLGIQGAFYGFGDGRSCTPPTNICAGGACCITGATLATEPDANWGCGIGLDLRSAGGSPPTLLPYSGPATCFTLELTGTSGGSDVRLSGRSHLDMTGRTAPLIELGPIAGDTVRTVCFSDLTCPAWAAACEVTGSWYNLQLNVVGGRTAGSFNLCLRSLIAFP